MGIVFVFLFYSPNFVCKGCYKGIMHARGSDSQKKSPPSPCAYNGVCGQYLLYLLGVKEVVTMTTLATHIWLKQRVGYGLLRRRSRAGNGLTCCTQLFKGMRRDREWFDDNHNRNYYNVTSSTTIQIIVDGGYDGFSLSFMVLFYF